MHIAKVVLAAGQSSRFNGCKLTADIGNNKSMICNALDILQNDDELPIFVISGAWHSQIVDALNDYKHVEIINNPHWQSGLGKTIAVATQVITSKQQFDGILFTLADQVELNCKDISALLREFINTPTRWCADYGVRIGVPAIFPSTDFNLLKTLSCEKGAQHLLRDTNAVVNTLKMAHAHTDIDTQNQLKLFLQSNNVLLNDK